MMNSIFFIMTLLVILVTGCALSPQTVNFKTLIDAPSHPIGKGRDLVLQVVDQRSISHFGRRGGVYDTAVIVPGTDVAQTVRRALVERLSASGFDVRPPAVNAQLSLQVEIQAIEYHATGDPIIDRVHIYSALQAVVRNGQRLLKTQYQVENTHRVAGPPSASRNEELLNEALTQTLQQLLQDDAVIALLQQ